MRLNLGCGGQIVEGWENVDRAFSSEQLASANARGIIPVDRDLRDLPWVYDDDSIECTVMHHVLDLFEPEQLMPILREVHRVLRSGGTLRVSSVDYGKAFQHFYDSDLDWFRGLQVPIVDVDCYCGNGWVDDEGWGAEFRGHTRTEGDGLIPCGACGGSAVDVERTVRSAFEWWLDCGGARKCMLATPKIVTAALRRAGFETMFELDYMVTTTVASIAELDTRESESFYVEGRK